MATTLGSAPCFGPRTVRTTRYLPHQQATSAPLLRTCLHCARRSVVAAAERSGSAAATVLDDPGTRAFLSWTQAARIASKSLAPATFGGLRGMAATSAVAPDDLLVSVPRSSAIVLAPRQKCPFPDWIRREYWDAAPWFVKMALLLLKQQREGSTARLEGYLRQLPSAVDVPVLWDDKTLKSLQYDHLIQLVKAQQDEWDRLHQDLLNKGLQPGAEPLPRQDFYWALSCVRSRTFSGPYVGSSLSDRIRLALLVAALALTNATLGIANPETTASAALAVFVFNLMYELLLSRSTKQYAMCPLIDFINHSSTVESEVSYEYISDSFTVVASRAYQKGDQVFVNYGQNNDGLMQYYGFSEPDNAKDMYIMTNLLTWLGQVAPADQGRLDSLSKAGLLKGLQMVSISRTGVPGEALQALRYLLVPATDTSEPTASTFATPGSPELEARVAAVLVHACRQELGSLGTTIAEDTELLANANRGRGNGPMLSPSERSAVAFRLEKKKVLAACLKSLGAEVGQGSGTSAGAEAASAGQQGAGAKRKGAKGFA